MEGEDKQPEQPEEQQGEEAQSEEERAYHANFELIVGVIAEREKLNAEYLAKIKELAVRGRSALEEVCKLYGVTIHKLPFSNKWYFKHEGSEQMLFGTDDFLRRRIHDPNLLAAVAAFTSVRSSYYGAPLLGLLGEEEEAEL